MLSSPPASTTGTSAGSTADARRSSRSPLLRLVLLDPNRGRVLRRFLDRLERVRQHDLGDELVDLVDRGVVAGRRNVRWKGDALFGVGFVLRDRGFAFQLATSQTPVSVEGLLADYERAGVAANQLVDLVLGGFRRGRFLHHRNLRNRWRWSWRGWRHHDRFLFR
uniref:(northern house mosquito) hypothetical protein n=1 Tax=Culex pipiens TaxID=7175 RepID=A0A8D8B2M4_CULPI